MAVLVLFYSYFYLASPSDLIMYHAFRGTADIALPPIILLALLTAAGFLLLQLTHGTRFWPVAQGVFVAAALFGIFKCRWLIVSSLGIAQNQFPIVWPLLAVLLAGAAAWFVWARRRGTPTLEFARHACNLLLVTAAALGVINLWQIGAYLFYKPAADRPLAAFHPGAEDTPRVIWIVLDELSYSQVYETRWPGLQLPNFDALRAHSTLYSDVQPVGNETERVLPSLIDGVQYDSLKFRNPTLYAQPHSGTDWRPVTPASSIFNTAQQNGWNAAVSGWYNPYCRLYSPVLQQCFTSALQTWAGKMVLGAGVMRNLGLEARILRRDYVSDLEVRTHRQDSERILASAFRMIDDPRLDLVFIHLPEPHTPTSLDRHTGKLTDRGGRSYADGLAYADIVLGELMARARQSPRWQHTTVIVNGDHGWRIASWKITPYWTPEDQAMSIGHENDLRPAVIVHTPGQVSGNVASTPVSLMLVHDTVEQIIRSNPCGAPPAFASAGTGLPQ